MTNDLRSSGVCTRTYAAVFFCASLLLASASGQPVPKAPETKQSSLSTTADSEVARALHLSTVQLDKGYPDLAAETCAVALKTHPENGELRDCLETASLKADADAQKQARTLQQAQSLLRLGKKTEAISTVEKILPDIRRPAFAHQAESILEEAGRVSWPDRTKQFLSQGGISWIVDVAIALLLLALLYGMLKGLRALKRFLRRRSLRFHTSWRVAPIQDSTNLQTASFVLSAYNSMKSTLSDSYNAVLVFAPGDGKKRNSVLTWQREELWDAGESYADSMVEDLSSGALPKTGSWLKSLAAELKRWVRSHFGRPKPEGFLQLQQQDFEFIDAVKQLGVSVGGASVQGVGAFVSGIGKWFDAGIPTLAGTAFLDPVAAPNKVVVSLTRSDARRFTVVTAESTDTSCGGAQQTAEEAVYKMLFLLGHQRSTAEDADIAASVRRQKRVVERYLTPKRPVDDELGDACAALSDARERIALSRSIPKFLIDRCLIWEAAARFLRAKDDDLDQVLELLNQLMSTEEKSKNDYYAYNASVIHHQASRLKEAHSLLMSLGQPPEPVRTLVLYAKIWLLADSKFQKIWGDFKDDVQTWKTEILKFARGPQSALSNEFRAALQQIRPADAVVWNTILAAELDWPEPRRPVDNPGDPTRLATLAGVQNGFENELKKPSADLADAYLQLARVHLFLGHFKNARDLSDKSQQESSTPNAVQLYVKAEATYSDVSLDNDSHKRGGWATNIISSVKEAPYPPLRALRQAIASELGSPPDK